MRILHVNKFLHRRGGAEACMLDLAALQREAGHDVAFWGMDHPANDVPCAGRPARHVELDPPPPGLLDRVALLGRTAWSREAARAMVTALEQHRPDVVHAHNVYHQLSPSVLHAAAERGVPVVMTLHDYKLVCPTYRLLDEDGPCTRCVTRGPWVAATRRCRDGSRAAGVAAAVESSLHRWWGAYGAVDRFLAPSQFLADQLELAGVGRGRVHVVPNSTPLPPRPHRPARTAPGAPVVVAGRLSHEKGVDVVIRALALLGTEGPCLEVAGDGPERQRLEALAQRVLPGRVRFRGHLSADALRSLLAGAAAAVVASRWHENQPLAVLEAQALAVPVVVTDLGGLPELVDDACGWVVPADDPEALAQALRAVLADPEGAAARGRAGRARVEARHAPAAQARAVEQHYRDVAAGRSQSREDEAPWTCHG